MTYDLALYPAPGPGLGHLMRCFALAEAAVEAKAKVLVVLSREKKDDSPRPAESTLPRPYVAPEAKSEPTSSGWPELLWPCPVVLVSDTEFWNFPVARLRVIDWPEGMRCMTSIGDESDVWSFRDSLGPRGWGGAICPHFGATAIPHVPTFYGEQWMPLRKGFGQPWRRRDIVGVWASYRWASVKNASAKFIELDGSTRWHDEVGGLVCPPSTIAYEAMAVGIPVAIHDDHEHPQIARAMIEAGVAVPATDWSSAKTTNAIDGLGAKRLIEALL